MLRQYKAISTLKTRCISFFFQKRMLEMWSIFVEHILPLCTPVFLKRAWYDPASYQPLMNPEVFNFIGNFWVLKTREGMRFAPSPPHPQPLALKERISLHFVELNIFSGFFTPPMLRKEVIGNKRKIIGCCLTWLKRSSWGVYKSIITSQLQYFSAITGMIVISALSLTRIWTL